jgi:hypothetical protein
MKRLWNSIGTSQGHGAIVCVRIVITAEFLMYAMCFSPAWSSSGWTATRFQ